MKKIILFILLATSFTIAKVNVIVSVLPEKTFIEAIGGEKIDVTVMVLPGSSPHAYEPKPSQMKDISKADIYLSIGVEFEKAWLPKFINQNRKMKIIDAAAGIEKLEIMSAHHHDGGSEQEHHHGGLDPHIWTSPKNVKTIAKNMYAALIEIDNKNRDYYKDNYDKFIAKIDALDTEIKNILSNTPKGSKFMVFHPAWGYFARDYNLKQIAIEAGGKNPKVKQLINLIKEAKEERVKAVFTAPEFSQNVAKQIAKEVGVPVVAVSPLNPKWSQNLIGLAKAIANR